MDRRYSLVLLKCLHHAHALLPQFVHQLGHIKCILQAGCRKGLAAEPMLTQHCKFWSTLCFAQTFYSGFLLRLLPKYVQCKMREHERGARIINPVTLLTRCT